MGTEPVGKLLLKLALPAVAAQIINMLYNLVDRIYIGHIPDIGALALTGVGVCMPIIMLVSAFAAFASMGGAPRASIYLGKKDSASAEKVIGNCFVFLIAISAILTTILLVFTDEILMLFGASENTIDYASKYMRIYAIGTIFVQLALGMNAFISAQGFAKMSMLTVLIGAVLNIILDPIFIFALKLDVAGAAIATVISQGVSAIFVICVLSSKKSTLRLKIKNMKIDFKILFSCLTLGFASFVMQSTESVVIVCFNSSLLKYGGDIAVGAMTILSSVMQFTMLPLQGFGQGAQPIMSYNFGAGNSTRVKAVFKRLLVANVCYSGVLWVLIMAMPQVFAKIFTSDAALVSYAGWSMRIYMGAAVLMGVQMACQMSLIAIGNAKASVFVAIIRKIILLIPLIYLMPLMVENGALAVFLAEPIADVIAVSMTVIIFAVSFKKAMKKLNAIDEIPDIPKNQLA
ncbi:MAG: MATE family efflux transporter [Clostridia bacterium]